MLEEILEVELSKCGDLQGLEIVQQGEKKIIAINKRMKRKKRIKLNQLLRMPLKISINKKNDIHQQQLEKCRYVNNLEISVSKIESSYQYSQLKRYAEVQAQYGFRLIGIENHLRIAEIKKLKYEQENSILDAQINLDQLERNVTKQQDLLQEKESMLKKLKNVLMKKNTYCLIKNLRFLNEKSINTNPIDITKLRTIFVSTQRVKFPKRSMIILELTQSLQLRKKIAQMRSLKRWIEVRQQIKSRAQKDILQIVVPPKKDKKSK